MDRILILSAVIAMTACSSSTLGVSNEQECIQEYAVPSAAPRGTLSGVHWCQVLFNPESTAEYKATAKCLLPQFPKAQTDRGMQAAFFACQ